MQILHKTAAENILSAQFLYLATYAEYFNAKNLPKYSTCIQRSLAYKVYKGKYLIQLPLASHYFPKVLLSD